MPRNAIDTVLAEHPRLTGALFTASILLMQAGNVLAGGGGGTSGP